jgi:hypothetical protein
MSNSAFTRITLAAAIFFIGGQAIAQPRDPGGGPTVSGTVNIGNAPAVATAIARALLGTPVAIFLLHLGSTYTVPSGQLLVIEYVSGQCVTSPPIDGNVGIQATTNRNLQFHQFSSPVFPTASQTQTVAPFGDVVKIYADPGSDVLYAGTSNNCSSLTLSGRLLMQ